VLIVGTNAHNRVFRGQSGRTQLSRVENKVNAFIARTDMSTNLRIVDSCLMVDIKSSTGCDALISECQRLGREILSERDPIPESLWIIRKKLRAEAKLRPIMERSEFLELTEDKGQVRDDAAVSVLRACGWIECFEENEALSTWVFLDPGWLAKTISQVLAFFAEQVW
jgi:hypothetical protein